MIWLHSVLSSASESDDPLLKAQLALELADLPEHPGRLALAREAADHPLPLAVLRGHIAVDLSPDGTRILATTVDGTAWIWAADGSGEPIAVPARVSSELLKRATPKSAIFAAPSPSRTRMLAGFTSR